MKDYASMSDEQIAVMVAGLCTIEGVSINEDGIAVRNVVDDSPGSYSGGDYIEFDFNPCNNPEDAWPIITENKISIMFDSTDTRYEGEYHEWCDAISSCQKFGIQHQSNPLRAAMIVFLMMNEGEK